MQIKLSNPVVPIWKTWKFLSPMLLKTTKTNLDTLGTGHKGLLLLILCSMNLCLKNLSLHNSRPSPRSLAGTLVGNLATTTSLTPPKNPSDLCITLLKALATLAQPLTTEAKLLHTSRLSILLIKFSRP